MRMLKQFFLLSGFLLLLLLNACKDESTGPAPAPSGPKDTLTLTEWGTDYRSISVAVYSVPLDSSTSVRLYRLEGNESSLIAEYPSALKDTIIVDDDNGNGLLLNTEFQYFAVRKDTSGNEHDSSNVLSASTKDTVGQIFTFQQTLLGDDGSTLKDIWGTDENNYWAAGSVRVNGVSYGLIHNVMGQFTMDSSASGNAIFGFSSDDIWLAGSFLFHFDGTGWRKKGTTDSILISNSPYNCLWGTSSNSLYLGSNNGRIIHWNGSSASVLYSNNTIPLKDITGFTDNFILACGSHTNDYVLIKFENNTWTKNTSERFNTVYVVSPQDYYGAGTQIKRFRNGVGSPVSFYAAVFNKMRGNKTTGEIGIAADQSTFYNYNGIRWTRIEITLAGSPPPFNSIFLSGDQLIGVGSYSGKARVVTALRQ